MRKLLSSAIATAIACSIAVPAFAHSSVSGNVKTEVRAEVRVGKRQASAADLACMQAALTKRENALMVAVDVNNASWKASLTVRRDELVAAWTLTDAKARRDAVKASWKKFREARKSHRETLRSARKTAWTQFKIESKACKADASVEAGAEVVDSQN